MRISRMAVVPTISLLLACGSSKKLPASNDSESLVAADVSKDSGPRASADSTPPEKAPTCPRTGKWARCSVEKRLEQSGFVLRKVVVPGPKRAGFSVTPTTYLLGSAKLEVFLYPDEVSLARDWGRLDTLTASPRGTTPAWEAPPTLIRSANLAALFISDSPTKSDRLALALTAGPPQPGITRSSSHVTLPAVHISPPASKTPR
jgi:hypothetical protein